MLRPRVIPLLLIDNRRMVKTVNFTDSKYIGDPINALKIFNEKEVDELIVLDIGATRDNREPDIEFIKKLAGECFMPFSYGGGITTISHIRSILKSGAEKVSLNSCLRFNSNLISEAASIFGSQSIIVSLDVKKDGSHYGVFGQNGTVKISNDIVEYAKKVEILGAGEILLNSIDKDGMMNGYDCELVRKVSEVLNIPLIACGGAEKFDDFRKVIKYGKASGAAAGSYFVFCGSRDAILITYPDPEEIESLF